MKKIIILLLLLSITTFITGCKSDKKEKSSKVETKKNVAAYVLSEADNSVEWTAYKTTKKVPVKGKFKTVNITAGGEGNSVKEAINNAAFSIPVSSIFTSDSSRDFKIRKFFFGIMQNTKLLSGKLVIENDSLGYANITMNGVTEKLPFTYTIKGKQFSMATKMDVLNWNAKNSIDSLNVVCKDLHKGLDGISKTWSEVAISISSTFK
ncbi:MAG: YceI family protein [Flavobacteriaceae bacterium]